MTYKLRPTFEDLKAHHKSQVAGASSSWNQDLTTLTDDYAASYRCDAVSSVFLQECLRCPDEGLHSDTFLTVEEINIIRGGMVEIGASKPVSHNQFWYALQGHLLSNLQRLHARHRLDVELLKTRL
ncbi:hypothetical protein H2248_012455 [Termitomyces sp. 'cryptogamus']|nr:hypothetical protein H2248_012455 [Termitomyces sp. 'cryptogamus']